MIANECFDTWMSIMDRMLSALPDTAPASQELSTIRARMAHYLSREEGKAEEIEGQFRSFAVQHVELLTAAAKQVMSEVFQLIDPEIERLRKGKDGGRLSASDKAAGQDYIALLEECQRILGEINSAAGQPSQDH